MFDNKWELETTEGNPYVDERIQSSPKLPELIEQMKIMKEDEKFLIFSNFEVPCWLITRLDWRAYHELFTDAA